MQAELGDIVYVELPEAGSEVTKGETFGVVESVKVPAWPVTALACHSVSSTLLHRALPFHPAHSCFFRDPTTWSH